MYFWTFIWEDTTVPSFITEGHVWHDQPAEPSWIGLRFLLWIILCIKEYEGIPANISCDSVACVSCIITRGACLDWIDLDGAAATACSLQILLGKAHENALRSLALHYLQYDLYLCTFSRCISKIPCHCIPPCLSGKCGFCKFCEVHSFPKLTRYLLKNINTWFWNLIKYLFVYLFIFICFNDVKGRWKNVLFIFSCFRWPTFIYN